MIKTGGRPLHAAVTFQPSVESFDVIPAAPTLQRLPNGVPVTHERTTATTQGEYIYVQEDPVEGTVAELLRNHIALPYAIGTGDLTDNALGMPAPGEHSKKYPHEFLIRAVVYRNVRDDLDSYHDLASHFRVNDDVAACFGFPEDVPSHDTFRRAWNKLSDRQESKLEAATARIASVATDEGYDHIDTSAILSDDIDASDATPTLLESEKDRAYRRIEDTLEEIIDFERADNASVPHESLVDVAGFLARRNTFAEQGVDRAEVEGVESVDAETYRRAVRNKERDKVRTRDDETVFLEPRDWSISSDRDRCDTSDWHGTLEAGIEQLVEILNDEDVIDGPIPVNIDGSKRLYHKHPDGADEPPEGVYQETRFPTDYAWKDMSVNAVVNGRSIVLANISRVPGDKFFQAVRYLIDRARELVDVECFYADAEYSNTDVCRYIDRLGEEYVMKKGHRGRVNDILETFTGNADYHEGFVMNSTRKAIQHETTLFGVEKRGQIGVRKGTKRDSETEQTGLEEFGDTSGQLTFDDLADQDNDTEFVAFVTNRDIEGVGIDPDENPIGHDASNTVWGAAEDYRGRWSIETTFRQVKYQFLAKTTSRNLGVRRFYWMLAVLLYNSWAALNLMVQKSVPTISDDRPPVRAKVFLEELAARGRKWPPPG